MTAVLLITAGSYDAKIFGFECRAEATGSQMGLSAKPVFAYAPHTGCVKTVALSHDGQLLASGSTDEHIKLYDLKKRKELGDLLHHQGAVTGLQFHGRTHLLSSSNDGNMCVWRCKDWECLKTLAGHKQSINDLALHPTGRLALTVSRDRTMRTWNMLKGRCAYITRLPAEAIAVVWSPDGTHYVTLGAKKATIYSVQAIEEKCHVDSPYGALHAAAFLTNDLLALGTDDGHLLLATLSDVTASRALQLHPTRIKALQVVPSPFKKDSQWLISAASDGSIKVWDVDTLLKAEDVEEACILSLDTYCRLTCLDAVSLIAPVTEEGTEGVDLDDIEESEEEEDDAQEKGGDEKDEDEDEEEEEEEEEEDIESASESEEEDSESAEEVMIPAPKQKKRPVSKASQPPAKKVKFAPQPQPQRTAPGKKQGKKGFGQMKSKK